MQINPGASLLLKGMVGSTAFGLNHADSDRDYLGIYFAPTIAFHGLSEIQETFVFKNPDTTYHEAGKFCRLALKCNPTILDLLWLDFYNVRTELGTQLVNLRSNLLSEGYVRNAYLGYAVQQLQRLKDGNVAARKAKNARHLYRLLIQGYDLYTTGTYSVKLGDPEGVKWFGEKVGTEGDVDFAEKTINSYRNMFTPEHSVLPELPNSQPIEEWLLRVRHEFYQYPN